MRGFWLVLIGFFLVSNVVEIKPIFYLGDLSVGKFGPFLGVVFEIDQNLVLLSLRIHESPCLFSERLVVVLELKDPFWSDDNTFQFPCGFTVAQVFPLDHVEPVDLRVQVEPSHVSKIDLLV